jgi:hypothetical protein
MMTIIFGLSIFGLTIFGLSVAKLGEINIATQNPIAQQEARMRFITAFLVERNSFNFALSIKTL